MKRGILMTGVVAGILMTSTAMLAETVETDSLSIVEEEIFEFDDQILTGEILPPEEDFDYVNAFDAASPEGAYNSEWNHFVVNPYNINLYKMKDSVVIDLSNYSHPHDGYVTSRFGMRKYRYHYGTDVKLQVGDTVRAAFNGCVRIAKVGQGYGNYIVLRHANGLETVYGHLSKFLVTTDSIVRSGEPIALGGNTGRSTGPHLHFEIRYVGNAINPETLVDFENKTLKDTSFIVCAETFKYKAELASLAYYKVRKGDTLSGIAKKRGTTVSKLCKLNGITPKTTLKIGRVLRCS